MRMWTPTQLLVDISVAEDWCVNDLFPRQCLVLRSIETVAAPGGGYLGKSVTTDSHLEFPMPLGNEEFAETRRLVATERVSLCWIFFGAEGGDGIFPSFVVGVQPFLHASSSLGHSRFSVPFCVRHKMAHAGRKNTCNTKKIPKVRVPCVSGRE